MPNWRMHLTNPYLAGIVCSVLVLPAHFIGQEAALAFRRMINHIISQNDTLFEFASSSKANTELIHTSQAWSEWIIYGLITAIIAAIIARWLAGSPMSWKTIVLVIAIWVIIYLLVWNWDEQLQFALGQFKSGVISREWGPWPHAGSFGFFSGFIVGLILGAAPWRIQKNTAN